MARCNITVRIHPHAGPQLFYNGKYFMTLFGDDRDIPRVRRAFVRRRGGGEDYGRVDKELIANGSKINQYLEKGWPDVKGDSLEYYKFKDKKSVSLTNPWGGQ